MVTEITMPLSAYNKSTQSKSLTKKQGTKMATKKPATPTKPKQHTKAELLKAVSDKTSMTQTDLDKALGGILDQIKNILAKGESLGLVGFGKFEVSERAARDGRNPQTGEKMKIPASKAVKFSAGKDLKESVNTKKKKK